MRLTTKLRLGIAFGLTKGVKAQQAMAKGSAPDLSHRGPDADGGPFRDHA